MILNIKITINMVISFTMVEIDLALAKEIVLLLLKMIIVAIIRDEIHPMTIIIAIADLPVATIDTIIIDVALTIEIVDLTVAPDIFLENLDIIHIVPKAPMINITIDQ